ncbi:MAG: TonB-dependent receptor domain-containing protein, partial [Methylococcales bacterium]
QYTIARQEDIQNNNNIYAPITSSEFGKPERVTKAGVGGALNDNAMGNGAFQTVREGFNRLTRDYTDHGMVSLTATYNVIPELTLDATAGLDYISQRSDNFYLYRWNVDNFVTADVDGRLNLGTRQVQDWTLSTKALWNTNITSDLSSQAILGIQGLRTISNSQIETGVTFPGPEIETTGAGQQQTAGSSYADNINLGVVGQEQLGYKDYLFLTLGVRLDANSAFGTTFKTATFPKASVSVLPLKALEMSSPYVSTWRARVAYGQSGQQPGFFDKLTTYTALRSPDGSGVIPSNLGNPNLKPEIATEFEFGTEAGFLDDRVGVELTVWNRVVKDALIARQFAPSGGFQNTQLDNIGELKANGLDLSLNLNLIRGEDFSLSMFANGAYLKEEIASMGGAPPLKVGGSYPRYRNFIREGYAPGSFFGPKLSTEDLPFDIHGATGTRNGTPSTMADLLAYFGVPRDPTVLQTNYVRLLGPDGKPYTPNLANQNLPWLGANPNATSSYYLDHFLGKPMPDWSGSFGANFTVMKNVRIASLFEYKFGNFYVHNLTDAFRRSHATIGRNIHGASETEVIMVNPASSAQDRVNAAITWAKQYLGLSPYDGLNEIEKIYMVRLREISVTYDIPAQYTNWFSIGSASITFAGRNMALWTDYSGIDPETNVYSFGGGGTFGNNFGLGIEAFGVPLSRQYVFTLKLGL